MVAVRTTGTCPKCLSLSVELLQMTHFRNRSEGLNVGEGFPTTYSSFAVNADSRAADDRRRSSATEHGDASAKHGLSSGMKRRTSSPPRNMAYRPSRLRGNDSSPSSARFAFNGDSGISTTKKIQTLVKEYRKRWSFLLFFLVFSALLVFGVVLPVSRTRLSSPSKPGVVRREVTYRSTRVKAPAATPASQHRVQQGRFSRWAAAFFGSDSAPQVIIAPVGMAPEEVPDYSAPPVPKPQDVKIADKPQSRRSQKRMTEDYEGREDREHPSRAKRRAQASSLAEEDRLRELEMSKQRQVRRKVMERVAKAFKNEKATAEKPVIVEDSPDGEHILDIYEAAHPETVEMESDFTAD